MPQSRAEYFRTNAAECLSAAQAVRDSVIKQAYLDLAHAWRVLADEIEHLAAQTWHPKLYSGCALPHRSLDDFYEPRPMRSDRRGAKHGESRNVARAVEHPSLAGPHTAAGTGSGAPQRRNEVGRHSA